MDNPFSIFKNIKVARINSGLSQKDLAEKLGVSDKTISAYETGRAIPPTHTLAKIAEENYKKIKVPKTCSKDFYIDYWIRETVQTTYAEKVLKKSLKSNNNSLAKTVNLKSTIV